MAVACAHHLKRFNEAERVMTNVLARPERRCLVWLAGRLPQWINSDHLTGLALFAMLGAGTSYWVSRSYPRALLLVVLWLGVNWFGDSLDGTLARLRSQQRPRYGFYVDHIVDCFGMLFLMSGLAMSSYMHPLVAGGFLVAYFMLSIEIYLATYCLTVFRLSFWGMGPTELRILLAVGTITLMSKPVVEILGRPYRLFDVGGLVAITCIALTLVVSVGRNIRSLYRAEPLAAATKLADGEA